MHDVCIAILDANGHLVGERAERLVFGDASGDEPLPGDSPHDLQLFFFGSFCSFA
jgi:hypothetical protein